MDKERWAATGAIGASFLIASCCLGPALFLLFGVSVGALGTLSVLEPVRPLFIAVGGLALAYAARRAWAPIPEADCGEGACAPGSASRRRTRWLVGVAVVLYLVAIVYPTALALLLEGGA